MPSSMADDYAARAAACERCAIYLEGVVAADAAAAQADAWLAKKLRTDAESWKVLSTAPATRIVGHDSSRPFLPAPKKVGKPLTDRMVESLAEMKRGAKVESEEFFAWPRWRYEPDGRRMSLACPTRAMLEGLHDRGLLSVVKEARRWITTVNEAGLAALLAHEHAKKTKKPSPFKEYGTSYAVTNSRGTRRCGGPRVQARTDKEVIRKVQIWLQNRHIGEQVSDIRIEWRPSNA